MIPLILPPKSPGFQAHAYHTWLLPFLFNMASRELKMACVAYVAVGWQHCSREAPSSHGSSNTHPASFRCFATAHCPLWMLLPTWLNSKI
jgi:hypothetical protein